MLFRYKGYDKTGKRVKGTVEATTQTEAAQKLRNQGILYDQLNEAKSGSFSFSLLSGKEIPTDTLATFCK